MDAKNGTAAKKDPVQERFAALLKTRPLSDVVRPHNSFYLIGEYSIDRTFGIKKCKFSEPDANGKVKIADSVPVCAKPLIPTAIYDNSDDHIQKVDVAFWNRGKWEHNVVPRSVLTNKNKILQLADIGYPVGSDNSGYVARYFLSVLSEIDERLPRKSARSNMGWCETEDGKAFLPYTDAVAFDGDDAYSHLYRAICERGSLAEWIAFMNDLRAEKKRSTDVCNIPIRLMMAASFASPLIELIGQNPFMAHMFAPTGGGKTVSLMVAASIWGDPEQGRMIRSLNMTNNSMLSTAAFLNNIPFFGDELQTLKSRWNKSYDQIVMQLCEGSDRGRMQNNILLKTKSWRCAFVTTGEDPIINDKSGGGAINRVVQIEMEGNAVADGNKTANFVRRHYGTAGRQWVNHVMRISNLMDRYDAIYAEITKKSKTTEKQAGAMAILLLADNLASDLFWPDEHRLTVDDVKGYLASAEKVDIAERAWDYILNVIAENGANFDELSRIRFGMRDGRVVWINKSILCRLLSDSAYDFDAIKKRWVAAGHLEQTANGKYAWYKCVFSDTAYFVKLIVPSENEITSGVKAKDEDLPFSINTIKGG